MDKINVNEKVLLYPMYFPSISSIKNNYRPIEHLTVLNLYKNMSFLISAFDIFYSTNEEKEKIKKILNMKNNSRIIFMDSGNYESAWDKSKKWTIDMYNSIIDEYYADIYFSYDNQSPANDNSINLLEIGKSLMILEKHNLRGLSVPIIHAKYENLFSVIELVVDKIEPVMIAIPERILGDGILSRIKTLIEIRRILNSKSYYIPIHLLGTGNPLSIQLFSFFGADTFDGLEWCQTAVNFEDDKLYHFQQRELFTYQDMAINNKYSYSLGTLCHNLNYYDELNSRIKRPKTFNELKDGIRSSISGSFWESAAKLMEKKCE